jgi:hypothetical protein
VRLPTHPVVAGAVINLSGACVARTFHATFRLRVCLGGTRRRPGSPTEGLLPSLEGPASGSAYPGSLTPWTPGEAARELTRSISTGGSTSGTYDLRMWQRQFTDSRQRIHTNSDSGSCVVTVTDAFPNPNSFADPFSDPFSSSSEGSVGSKRMGNREHSCVHPFFE